MLKKPFQLFFLFTIVFSLGCSSTIKEVSNWSESDLVCSRAPIDTRAPASTQSISKLCQDAFQASGLGSTIVQIEIPTNELQRQWKELSLGQVFDAVENPEYWSRLINLTRVEDYEGKASHPIEAFGEESALAWSRADSKLKQTLHQRLQWDEAA